MGNQAMHVFTARPPYVSAAEPNLCDPRDAPWFMIGMPHLDGQGLSLSWLLREAGHLHWSSALEYAGRNTSDLKDVSGKPALPGVLALVVTGRTDAFKQDDVVELRLAQRPSALNGWRSITELRATTGTSLTVELVTCFAVRGGTSNHSLEHAMMAPELVTERGTMTSRRTDQIRRMGSAARRAAEADIGGAGLSVQISPHLHLNGLGLACFAVVHDLFIAAEGNASVVLPTGAHFDHRRVHYFGNLDEGDRLDISTKCESRPFEGGTCLSIVSYAKRRADGLVVAVCESVYRR